MQKGASDVAYNQGYLKLLFEKENKEFSSFPIDAVRKIDRHDHRLSKIVNITALLFHAAREKN